MKTPSKTNACGCIDEHLEHLFAAFAAAGMLSAEVEDVDFERIADDAMKFGRKMAAKAKRGRKRQR